VGGAAWWVNAAADDDFGMLCGGKRQNLHHIIEGDHASGDHAPICSPVTAINSSLVIFYEFMNFQPVSASPQTIVIMAHITHFVLMLSS
jgi:hypothetical protein